MTAEQPFEPQALSAPRLGQRLIKHNLITADQLHIALQAQRHDPALLGTILQRIGFVDAERLSDVLSAQLGFDKVDLAAQAIDPSCLNTIPLALAQREQCVAVRWQDEPPSLTIALADPQDLLKTDRIRRQLPANWGIHWVLAEPQQLAQFIELRYRQQQNTPSANDDSAITRCQHLLAESLAAGASDIHFEPEAHSLRIRLRIDGLLTTTHLLPKADWPALLVRLKLMGGMDISENRQAQDGRMTFEHAGKTIDIRLSTLPSLHGENLVLRLLDRNKGIVPLSSLGLDSVQLGLIEHLLNQPEGLVLITGPTGSGKTTTLYALLQALQDDSRHIMTLEDPVEYALPGIRQSAIDPPRLDFASGIRAMLRQDPDILLIGEIRDEDTAHMALRAAHTGHRVLSTLHASSPLTALPRLQQLGLSLNALRGSLTGILAQRLVRKLCPDCRLPYAASPMECQQLGISDDKHPDQAPILYAPQGCPACQQRGYIGRLALLEILPFTDDLNTLLDDHTPVPWPDLEPTAQHLGWRSLANIGRQLVLQGNTSAQELWRVIAPPAINTAMRGHYSVQPPLLQAGT